MSSFFRKSPERVADILFPVCIEAAMNIARKNFLALNQRSIAYVRFVVGCEIFTNLMCQDMVASVTGYDARSLVISELLTEKHLAQLSRHFPQLAPIADIVVWQDEIDHFTRSPTNPSLTHAYFSGTRLPLHDIVRELYVVRGMMMTTDMLNGATVGLQQGPGSLALLMPVCSSLIMQTTAHQERAVDEKTVAGFAASLLLQWMFLQGGVQEALK